MAIAPSRRSSPPAMSMIWRTRSLRLRQHNYRWCRACRNGQLDKQIAYELGVVESTIESHMTTAPAKLGVQNARCAGGPRAGIRADRHSVLTACKWRFSVLPVLTYFE
ncbi:LuxR C-terminal-related transcriptional regulator [Sphingobium sp. Leaf26]|uniref:LuxR C-terminal-related transcriptional regulator n=1 Tax=Sphingobium sp. Leaf26 TaxID=1735693 RepID=UPI0009EBEEBA